MNRKSKYNNQTPCSARSWRIEIINNCYWMVNSFMALDHFVCCLYSSHCSSKHYCFLILPWTLHSSQFWNLNIFFKMFNKKDIDKGLQSKICKSPLIQKQGLWHFSLDVLNFKFPFLIFIKCQIISD